VFKIDCRQPDASAWLGSQTTDKSRVNDAWKAKYRVYHSLPLLGSFSVCTNAAISRKFSWARVRQVLRVSELPSVHRSR
jgi:hypothetical protein